MLELGPFGIEPIRRTSFRPMDPRIRSIDLGRNEGSLTDRMFNELAEQHQFSDKKPANPAKNVTDERFEEAAKYAREGNYDLAKASITWLVGLNDLKDPTYNAMIVVQNTTERLNFESGEVCTELEKGNYANYDNVKKGTDFAFYVCKSFEGMKKHWENFFMHMAGNFSAMYQISRSQNDEAISTAVSNMHKYLIAKDKEY